MKFYQADPRDAASKSRVLAKLNDQTPLCSGTANRRRQGAGVHLDLRQRRPTICRCTGPLGAVRASNPRPIWAAAARSSRSNLTVDSYVELRTAREQERRGGSAGSGRKAAVVARGSDLGEEFRGDARRIFRSEDRQRTAQSDRGPCRPAGIRSAGDSAGNAGFVEGHRSGERRGQRAAGGIDGAKSHSVEPLACAFIAIVISSGGRIGGGGPVLARLLPERQEGARKEAA